MRFVRLACPLALALVALPAAAGNLVGSWLGSFTCRIEDSGGRTSDTEAQGAFNEIESIRWRVGADGKGSIRKRGAFVVNGEEVGTCTGSWRRTNTTDPGIGACP